MKRLMHGLLAVTTLGAGLIGGMTCIAGVQGCGRLFAPRRFDLSMKAYDLQQAGQWEEALAVHREVADRFPGAAEWENIARCEEELGNYEAALAAHDQGIKEDGGWSYVARARCMARHEGAEAAEDWLQERLPPEVQTRRWLLGQFFYEEGEHRRAIEQWRPWIEQECVERDIEWDEHDAVVLVNPDGSARDVWGTELWEVLDGLAHCYLKVRENDEAWTWSTRLLSMDHQVAKRRGYSLPGDPDAGSIEARVLRAFVLIRRRELDEAQREVAFARTRASYTCTPQQRRWIESAERWIAKYRAEDSVRGK